MDSCFNSCSPVGTTFQDVSSYGVQYHLEETIRKHDKAVVMQCLCERQNDTNFMEKRSRSHLQPFENKAFVSYVNKQV